MLPRCREEGQEQVVWVGSGGFEKQTAGGGGGDGGGTRLRMPCPTIPITLAARGRRPAHLNAAVAPVLSWGGAAECTVRCAG